MTDFGRLLQTLAAADIRCAIIGGVAAVAHGAGRMTQDLDIVYDRSPDNLELLANALRPLRPYLRGAPPGLPFLWDVLTLSRGLNFTLTTDAGDIDLFGEIVGGGTWADLLPHFESVSVYGQTIRVLSLRKLIEVKRAAGRPKDFEAIAELETLLEERDAGAGSIGE